MSHKHKTKFKNFSWWHLHVHIFEFSSRLVVQMWIISATRCFSWCISGRTLFQNFGNKTLLNIDPDRTVEEIFPRWKWNEMIYLMSWTPDVVAQSSELMIKVCDNLVLYHIYTITHITFLRIWPKCVGFRGEGKPEYPERNPQGTGEINYNSTMKRKSMPRLGLAFFFGGERQRANRMCHPFFHLYKQDIGKFALDMKLQ